MHADFYDRAYFDGTGKSNYCSYTGDSSPFAAHADAVAAMLREYSLDGPVLDIGCAKGYLVARAAPARHRRVRRRLVAVRASRRPTPQVRPHLHRAAAHELPFADGQFALAVSFDVLEHMDLGVRAARRCRRSRGCRGGNCTRSTPGGSTIGVTTATTATARGCRSRSGRRSRPTLGLHRTVVCEPDRRLPFLSEVHQ